ncbi:MAG: hypothetical protein M3395_10500 [Chloroflexota bacterium]|nr:hypothetical protein [Chloroflexota bacterium]
MNDPHPATPRFRRHRLTLLALALILASACTAVPQVSPTTDGSPSPGSPGPDGSPATGSSTPSASATAGPTSPLFGQPPPLDPCELLLPTEIQSVLEGPYFITEQESSRGAAYTCIYESEDRTNRVAVTVRKPPVTLEQFIQRMEGFGDRATAVTDLGVPAALVVFGPTATVYALHDDVQFYIDVAHTGRTGGDISPLALGLMERALFRLEAADAGSGGDGRV